MPGSCFRTPVDRRRITRLGKSLAWASCWRAVGPGRLRRLSRLKRRHAAEGDAGELSHVALPGGQIVDIELIEMVVAQALARTFIRSTDAVRKLRSCVADLSTMMRLTKCGFCVAMPTGQLLV